MARDLHPRVALLVGAFLHAFPALMGPVGRRLWELDDDLAPVPTLVALVGSEELASLPAAERARAAEWWQQAWAQEPDLGACPEAVGVLRGAGLLP